MLQRSKSPSLRALILLVKMNLQRRPCRQSLQKTNWRRKWTGRITEGKCLLDFVGQLTYSTLCRKKGIGDKEPLKMLEVRRERQPITGFKWSLGCKYRCKFCDVEMDDWTGVI